MIIVIGGLGQKPLIGFFARMWLHRHVPRPQGRIPKMPEGDYVLESETAPERETLSTAVETPRRGGKI
jgi:hypothetical protein